MRCYDCQSEYHLVGSKFCKKKSGYYAEEEKSNFAARKVAEETGYKKKWLYSKLHKSIDK